MSRDNAARRWGALLTNPKYGVKLGRLTKTQQREVKTLTEQNEGARARAMVMDLDQERRTKERLRSQLRRFLAMTPDQRRRANRVGTSPFRGANDEIAIVRKLYEGRNR